MPSNRQLFWITFLLIAIVEMCSLFAYTLNAPYLQVIFLVLTLLLTGILAIINFEYGLLVVFAELFTSSFGHLFQIEFGPIRLSLRIGLFMLINSIYFFKSVFSRSFAFRRSRYFWPCTAFTGAIFLSFLVAAVNNNDWKNIFNDADGYVMFAYFAPAFAVFASRASRERLAAVFTAALVWLGLQTAVVLFVFAHRMRTPMQVLYFWIRDARIGEITHVAGDFYRIFFQSYIFALAGIFVFGALLIQKGHSEERSDEESPVPSGSSIRARSFVALRMIIRSTNFWLLALSFFLVLESFSRSFWFGAIIAFVVMIILMSVVKVHWKVTGLAIARFGAAAVVALVMIFALVNFPWPQKGTPILLADLFGGRAFSLVGEAAAASRWELFPKLVTEIKKSPILGSGFGKTVTYKSSDPRVIAETGGTGIYTTYAFEWSYLDLWLKLGLVGLVIYGWLIYRILHQGWRALNLTANNHQWLIEFGIWLSVVALLAANVFTPYLNHPLGVGFLILGAIFFEWSDQRERSREV